MTPTWLIPSTFRPPPFATGNQAVTGHLSHTLPDAGLRHGWRPRAGDDRAIPLPRCYHPDQFSLTPANLPPPPGRSSTGFTLRNSHELRRQAAKLARPFRPQPAA